GGRQEGAAAAVRENGPHARRDGRLGIGSGILQGPVVGGVLTEGLQMTVGTLARVAALVVLVQCVTPVVAAAEPAAGAGAEAGAGAGGAKIKSLRRLDETIKRFGGSGDNWHMSWASDDQMYA